MSIVRRSIVLGSQIYLTIIVVQLVAGVLSIVLSNAIEVLIIIGHSIQRVVYVVPVSLSIAGHRTNGIVAQRTTGIAHVWVSQAVGSISDSSVYIPSNVICTTQWVVASIISGSVVIWPPNGRTSCNAV